MALGDRGVGVPEDTCVVFTVPEKRLSAMDVEYGPCVPVPGRKHPLVSVHQQEGPERPDRMAALHLALTGRTSDDALQLAQDRNGGRLYRCSDRFVDAMADANELLVRLADEDRARERTQSRTRRSGRVGRPSLMAADRPDEMSGSADRTRVRTRSRGTPEAADSPHDT